MFNFFRVLLVTAFALWFSATHADDSKKCTRTFLNANLSSGFATPSVDATVPYLSQKGDQAYLLYQRFGEKVAAQQHVAQLFNNVKGELVIAQTLPADEFEFVYSGWASKDFTKFSVCDARVPHTARVRILDQNFNVVATRTITNRNAVYVTGGSFTEDNHYIVFGLVVSAPRPSVSYNTLVFVLDATKKNLPTVAGPITISGYDPDLLGPTLFTLTDSIGKKNLYLSFMSSQINSKGPEFDIDDSLRPPYLSQVYGVDVEAGSISLIDQVPLPKFAENTLFVRKSGKEALICHGGQCSNNPKLPSIYTTLQPVNICDLPGNCEAIRVLRFDGKKLKLFFKQTSICCSFLVVYPPSNGCAYFLGQSVENYAVPGKPKTQGPAPQEFWSLFGLEKGPSGLVLKPQAGPFQDLAIANTVFSGNGKWMLRAGAYGYVKGKPLKDTFGIKNVLLFKVSSAEYTPFCK